jgi:hypothetical protein
MLINHFRIAIISFGNYSFTGLLVLLPIFVIIGISITVAEKRWNERLTKLQAEGYSGVHLLLQATDADEMLFWHQNGNSPIVDTSSVRSLSSIVLEAFRKPKDAPAIYPSLGGGEVPSMALTVLRQALEDQLQALTAAKQAAIQ